MSFFYFLPNAKFNDIPASLSKWGLAYLFDDGDKPTVHGRECIGPEGQRGMVIGSAACWEAEQVKMPVGDAAGKLTWKKFPKPFAQEQAWIGFDKNSMPTPTSLRRSSQVSGEAITLADGHEWLVPIARRVTGTNLPVAYSLDEETGDWIADQVVPKYRKIWDHANAYLEAMTEAWINAQAENSQEVRWTIPDGNALVVDALRVNYRVSAMEVAVLGIMTSEVHQQIADVLIDANGWAAIKKKEVSDTGQQ